MWLREGCLYALISMFFSQALRGPGCTTKCLPLAQVLEVNPVCVSGGRESPLPSLVEASVGVKYLVSVGLALDAVRGGKGRDPRRGRMYARCLSRRSA